jgi:thiol-disulfide isomerase/thioredoxin
MKNWIFLLLFLAQFNLFAQNSSSENPFIIIKGNIENLPDGNITLTEFGKEDFLAKTQTKDGKFEFQIDANKYPEPQSRGVELVHFDEKNVKRRISYLTTKNPNDEKRYTNYFMIENGIEFNGILEAYQLASLQLPDSVKLMRLTSNLINAQQTDIFVSFHLALNKGYKIFDDIVKKHPYSFHLLYQLDYRKHRYTDEENAKIFNHFDKNVQESSTGLRLKNYFKNKPKYSLNPSLMLISADGSKKPIINNTVRLNMVILWASWCLPCIEEIPLLKEIHAKYSHLKGFRMVSVSVDRKHIAWEKALDRQNMPWEQLIMSDELYEYLKDWFPYEGKIPTVVFTDNDGKIMESYIGYHQTHREIYEKIIEKVNR